MSSAAVTWDLAGFLAVVVGGTVLHFCFDVAGRRRALAVFCPVNESVWEHLKMAYWPLLVLTAVQIAVAGGAPALVPARAIGFLVMCALILGLYLATAALAPAVGLRTRLAIDGTIFVMAVGVGQFVCHLLLTPLAATPVPVGAALLLAPIAVFGVTTFAPPRTTLFEDQVTGGYGIDKDPPAATRP